ncbi:MAG TPA: 2-oxoglutarate dehydrogenase E1 component [Verrucomicrobiales bacterium]|nr:2-oxoglutarate dehydrogenase E1 component [Verrucomicrobiales bacterium]
MSHTIPARANVDLIDQKYVEWKEDPNSVDQNWAMFFEGFELGLTQPASPRKGITAGPETEIVGGLDMATRARIVTLVESYRTLGHTAAWLDPLDVSSSQPRLLSLEELGFDESHLDEEVSTQFYEKGRRMKLRELVERLQRTYCQKIGFEFMHIQTPEIRNWIRKRVEVRIERPEPPIEKKKDALRWLAEAELFERFLHRKFVGQKRFSLEGGDALMVALNGLMQRFPELGVTEMVMGMAHRGRLNVLANLLHKPLTVLLYEFSDNYVPNLVAGDGDVKYHLGYESDQDINGSIVKIQLAANPSHLEAVSPVVEGKARARQRGNDAQLRDSFVDRDTIIPVLIHGDAAFAGQGSVTETLNLSQLLGYRTGGTVHIVINNQIGFTTTPKDARSSVYCTDVAKMIEAPVFHVNGDSPMDVLYVTELALDFRQRFGRDVVIDIVCYRRHGHNEGDEPAFTLPKTYHEISRHDTPLTIFRRELVESGQITEEEADAIEGAYQDKLDSEYSELEEATRRGDGHRLAEAAVDPQPEYSHGPYATGVEVEEVRTIGKRISIIPSNVNVNAKLASRFLAPRLHAIESGEGINWAFGEALAFGSLLREGYAVRLSGQDCRRGTFSHRHAVLYDSETRQRYTPLNHLVSGQKQKLWVYNSHLSEFAVLGFEYGYSLHALDALILWEAQFGDFANGAQVIIDQFISSAESKWQRASHLVLLLPHGYEGQGPEHSSARLERFLQLCADENMQVCNITTPAQYFHVLRRQMHRPFRKPLVIMTPKSLLTFPGCVSKIEEFGAGTCFHEIIDDFSEDRNSADRISRLIFCSGKVYYDLLAYRRENEVKNVAIIRIEQLYPFHSEKIAEIAAGYPNASKWVWCQEEPLNMGAWTSIGPHLQKLTDHRVRYTGRDTASSPSSGSKAIHKYEQKRLLDDAFNK